MSIREALEHLHGIARANSERGDDPSNVAGWTALALGALDTNERETGAVALRDRLAMQATVAERNEFEIATLRTECARLTDALTAARRPETAPIHGVTWVLLRAGCVLLERCPKKAAVLGVGEWFVPGGKIDGDETPDEALLRELGEEWPTVTLTRFAPLPIVEGSRVGVAPHGLTDRLFLMRPYVITTSSDVPRTSDEGTPLRWVPIADALASPVAQVRMMVAAACAHIESELRSTPTEPADGR